jgi:hypothetical protein
MSVDVIVGAFIGLGISLITSLVTHLFENARSKQARKWQIEERQTVELSEILSARINEVEKSLNTLLELSMLYAENERSLVDLLHEPSVVKMIQILFSSDSKRSISSKISSLKKKNKAASKKLLAYFEKEQKSLKEVPSITFANKKILSVVASLNQLELAQDVGEFIELVSNRVSFYGRLQILTAKQQKIDIENEKTLISKYMTGLVILHGKIINRLDTLRVVGKYKEMN